MNRESAFNASWNPPLSPLKAATETDLRVESYKYRKADFRNKQIALAGMSDTEAPPLASKPTFVKRSRPRNAGISRGSASVGGGVEAVPSSNGRRTLARNEDHDDTEDDGLSSISGVVRRSGGARGGGAGMRATGANRPEKDKKKRAAGAITGGDGGDDDEVSVRGLRSWMISSDNLHITSTQPMFEINSSAKASTSRLNLPSNLDQANLSGSTVAETATPSGYSASALAALKEATPSTRVRQDTSAAAVYDEDENPIALYSGSQDPEQAPPITAATHSMAYQTMADPMTLGDSTLRFGAGHLQGEEGQMPSESVIEAAKERRRRAAAGNAIGGDDYISLSDERQVSKRSERAPHPESTLQREEDEIGSGEDEFADFTGAKERIALTSRGRRREEAMQRKSRAEMIRGEDDDDGGVRGSPGDDADSGDDEYEQVQLRRMGMPGDRQRREKREKSPYRSAPLPDIIPVPGVGATSSLLAMRLAEVQDSLASHTDTIDNSTRSLAQLAEDETENKRQVEAAADKDGWMGDFTAFIESLADLMEVKTPPLDEISTEWDSLYAQRTRMVATRRTKILEDHLAFFWGVSNKSLLPAQQRKRSSDDADGNDSEVTLEEEPSPVLDGDAGSEQRAQRLPLQSDESLLPGDEASFANATTPLRARLASLLDDVQAPEFLWPDARLQADDSVPLHPSSVHSRYRKWRTRYPDDYNGAWGGLSLAGIWEFWAQRELALWDPLRDDLEASLSLQALQHWSEDAGHAALGGDDEVVSTLVNAVFVPRIMQFAECGGFDPWSAKHAIRAVRLARQVVDFVDKQGVRFQSLVGAHLQAYHTQIARLAEVLTSPPTIPPPGFHPESIPRRVAFVRALIGLLSNLLKWSPLVVSPQNRTQMAQMVDVLLSRMVWDYLRDCGETGKQMAEEVLKVLGSAPGVGITDDLRARLSALARASG